MKLLSGLSSVDKKLIALLSENGRMPVGEISKELKVSSPTVRSRMKGLLQTGVLKIGALIDSSKDIGVSIGIIGITLERYQQLYEKTEQISSLDNVSWAVIVSGRYDIIAEVILLEEGADFYRFLTEHLFPLGGIKHCESFMVMRTKRKWLFLPQGITETFFK